MSRAFKVTIPFNEISHAELPRGKFDVRVTGDGLYMRPSAGRKRRWRFLTWEDAVCSATWSEGPPVRLEDSAPPEETAEDPTDAQGVVVAPVATAGTEGGF